MASKLPKVPSASKLAQPTRLALPGSLSAAKRRREGSMDLETGLEAKKGRTADPPVSNLAKSRSKSMMNIAGKQPAAPSARPGTARPPVAGARARVPPTTGRPSTGGALNDRTNRSVLNASRGAPTPKAGVKAPGTAAKAPAGGKRPAWDVKGRMEDMERKFDDSCRRLETLEKEKGELQEDVEVKHEVVVKSSEEIKMLQKKIDESDELLSSLKKSLAEKEEKFKKSLEAKEEEHRAEVTRLRRAVEEEEFTKASLQRRVVALQDELAAKQTEILGLKQTVAAMAALEASLAGTKCELDIARGRVTALAEESCRKTRELEEGARVAEEQQGKLRWEETERRRLHNIIQELKGNIRVFCRMRPLLGAEREAGEITHVNIQGEKALELTKSKDAAASAIAGGLNKDMKYDFEFDRVFGPLASQAEVFAELGQLVQSALDGYNVCVFAYGQTGSGKTFTMEGGESAGEEEEQAGMIPRTIRQIFAATEQLKEKAWEYRLQASFLEIYNEEIRDLLAVDKDLKYEIKLTDSKSSELAVTNLRVEEVVSEGQVAGLLRRAGKARAQAKTLCNERSSRSHSVFVLKIEGHNTKTLETCSGVLNLVDLAGSERIKDSGSEGLRLTEAQAINKSLSNLGNVIMALAQKSAHIPYRNSKLTHLLQNSLGGNSKTLMFVNISPKEECFSETLNSLRFATKVNQCNIGTATKKTK